MVEPECDHCHQKVQPGYQLMWHTTSSQQTKRYDCYPSPTGRHMVDGSAYAEGFDELEER